MLTKTKQAKLKLTVISLLSVSALVSDVLAFNPAEVAAAAARRVPSQAQLQAAEAAQARENEIINDRLASERSQTAAERQRAIEARRLYNAQSTNTRSLMGGLAEMVAGRARAIAVSTHGEASAIELGLISSNQASEIRASGDTNLRSVVNINNNENLTNNNEIRSLRQEVQALTQNVSTLSATVLQLRSALSQQSPIQPDRSNNNSIDSINSTIIQSEAIIEAQPTLINIVSPLEQQNQVNVDSIETTTQSESQIVQQDPPAMQNTEAPAPASAAAATETTAQTNVNDNTTATTEATAQIQSQTIQQQPPVTQTTEAPAPSTAATETTAQTNVNDNITATTEATAPSISTPTALKNDHQPEIKAITEASSAAIANIIHAATVGINSRLSEIAGLAAGSELQPINIWVKSLFGSGKQQSTKESFGFKTKYVGGIIGADTMINDNNLIGIAYSHTELSAKFIGKSINSKIKADLLSLYLSSYLTQDIFLNSQLKYGSIKIRNNGYNVMQTSSTAFGIREEFGYQINAKNCVMFIPTIGLAYDQIKVKSFKNKITGSKEVLATGINNNKLDGLLGLTMVKTINMTGYDIMPSLYAKLDHTISRKNTVIKIIPTDKSMSSAVIMQQKANKNTYLIGGGIKFIKTNKFEVGFNYDLLLRKKFHSHTCSVKVRVTL